MNASSGSAVCIPTGKAQSGGDIGYRAQPLLPQGRDGVKAFMALQLQEAHAQVQLSLDLQKGWKILDPNCPLLETVARVWGSTGDQVSAMV